MQRRDADGVCQTLPKYEYNPHNVRCAFAVLPATKQLFFKERIFVFHVRSRAAGFENKD
nr:MAG TPA: hypothetical protein [Caudoviricetes sp.]